MWVIHATVASSPPRQDDAQLRPGHVVSHVDAFWVVVSTHARSLAIQETALPVQGRACSHAPVVAVLSCGSVLNLSGTVIRCTLFIPPYVIAKYVPANLWACISSFVLLIFFPCLGVQQATQLWLPSLSASLPQRGVWSVSQQWVALMSVWQNFSHTPLHPRNSQLWRHMWKRVSLWSTSVCWTLPQRSLSNGTLLLRHICAL